MTHSSPINATTYERIHALLACEIGTARDALRQAPWAQSGRLVLAGASEGAVPVARYDRAAFVVRIVYSWS